MKGKSEIMIRSEIDRGILTVYPEGRIDSTNSAQFENEMENASSCFTGEIFVIDAEKLEYISSAGLRVLLKIRKKFPSLKIVNASGEIYDILDMTGFTEMIKVEKAYRKMSVEGCEVIGQGANGKVYRIDPDTIIKVYLNPDSLDDIKRERELARRALILGIPTAISYDVVRVGEGYGSVFELLNAKSLTKLISSDPENIDKYITMYVDLLKKIHSTQVREEDMPDMKAEVVKWVAFLKNYIDSAKWQKLMKMTEEIPDDMHMIHGDYHTKNVMVQNGEVLLIDMDTLAHGDPVFEFAQMFNAYIGFPSVENRDTTSFLGFDGSVAKKIWDGARVLYFGTNDEEKLAEIENKAAIIGYTRLMRREIRHNGTESDESKKKISFCKEQIESRLEKTDSLVFNK